MYAPEKACLHLHGRPCCLAVCIMSVRSCGHCGVCAGRVQDALLCCLPSRLMRSHRFPVACALKSLFVQPSIRSQRPPGAPRRKERLPWTPQPGEVPAPHAVLSSEQSGGSFPMPRTRSVATAGPAPGLLSIFSVTLPKEMGKPFCPGAGSKPWGLLGDMGLFLPHSLCLQGHTHGGRPWLDLVPPVSTDVTGLQVRPPSPLSCTCEIQFPLPAIGL